MPRSAVLHLPGASEVGRADTYCAMTLMLIRPPGAAPCCRSRVPGASRLHAGPQTPHQLPPQVLFFLFFSSSSNYFFLSFLPRLGENRSAAVIGFKNLINSAAILVGIRKVRIGVSTITERAGKERASRTSGRRPPAAGGGPHPAAVEGDEFLLSFLFSLGLLV